MLQTQATNADLFFSKNDPGDPRLGDFAKALDLNSQANSPSTLSLAESSKSSSSRKKSNASEKVITLLGYPDDEGIRINGGRLGAALAPDVIRKYLYKMTPMVNCSEVSLQIQDAGNLNLDVSSSLEVRHENASALASRALENATSQHLITLGGGHDYGYADGLAFLQSCQTDANVRPLILNFDAHLDVRPTTKGLSSGTPFYRLLETDLKFDFAEIGIQSQCNSKSHWDYVINKGGKIVSQDDFLLSGLSLAEYTQSQLEPWLLKRRPCFLSIDMDGFSSSVAPGCSQSWATGFMPDQFWPLFHMLVRRLDVRLMGIYEVSPPLDQDDRTAKLAAQLIHHLAFQA